MGDTAQTNNINIMNASQGMSPELRAVLSAPVEQRLSGSLFTSHGIWAPGVGLMRNLNFAAKASLISLLFVIPLVISVYFLARDLQSDIDFSRKEATGLVMLEEFSPVLKGLNVMRGAMRAKMGGFAEADASYQAGKSLADKGVKAFATHLAESGDPLGVKPEFDKFQEAWSKAQPTTKTTGDTGFGDVSRTIVPLMRKIGDQSALVLDPDIESLYMVLAFVVSTPKLVDDLDQMWGWSVNALASGQLEDRNARRYSVWQSGVLTTAADIRDSLGRSIAAMPSLKDQLPLQTLDQLDAYHKQMQDPAKLMADAMPAVEAYRQGEQAMNSVFTLYDAGLKALEGVIEQRLAAVQAKRNTIGVLVGISVLLAVYFFYSFFLVTRGGLRLISTHLQEMAEGDLRKAPGQPWGRDEPAQVIVDLRKAYDSLHLLIRRVRHSARALHGAANDISAASGDLAQRTESAAASLEEQASVMEQIGSTVGATAERAKMASMFAIDNAGVAEKGGVVFDQVSTTMREIQQSSARINDIIGTIDGIAFQTNILALNAAVEAARAGESGRGFAVVASEVRSLAGRSAEAAQEIKALISQSVDKVRNGTRVVDEAGVAMAEVVANARQINQFLSEIATAASEQATGVTEVGHSIQDLDKTTQQNAGLVQQTTQASDALRQQADSLQEEIANFRVS